MRHLSRRAIGRMVVTAAVIAISAITIFGCRGLIYNCRKTTGEHVKCPKALDDLGRLVKGSETSYSAQGKLSHLYLPNGWTFKCDPAGVGYAGNKGFLTVCNGRRGQSFHRVSLEVDGIIKTVKVPVNPF